MTVSRRLARVAAVAALVVLAPGREASVSAGLGKKTRTYVYAAPIAPTATAYAPTYAAPATYGAAPTAGVTYAYPTAPIGAAPTAPLNYFIQPTAGAAPTVGQAPGDAPCMLTPQDRFDIVEDLKEARGQNKGATRSETREDLNELATERVASICDKDPEDLTAADKQLIRSLVSEAMGGHGPPGASGASGQSPYAYPYGNPYAYPHPPHGPAPAVLIPVIPVQLVAPVPPHRCHLLCPCKKHGR